METPAVLLVDDGELDEVRTLLEDLAVDFLHVRGPTIPDEVEEPAKLLVTTASRALTLQLTQSDAPRQKPIRVAFVTGESKTQRSLLRRAGFEFLVHSPAHPAAVRLLFVRALYRGTEKRGATRRALGCEVNYKTGLRRKKATLLEISESGCRLLMNQCMDRGTRLTLQIPRAVTHGKTLDLPGRVIRVIRGRRYSELKEFSVAIRFERLGEALEDRLARFLEDHASGPSALPEETSNTQPRITLQTPTIPDLIKVDIETLEPMPPPESDEGMEPLEPLEEGEDPGLPGPEEPPLEETSQDDENRREHQRVAYDQEVIAMSREATRVLLGQDISQNGMRVEPNENLRIGEYLRLGIYGKAGQDPLLVEAIVVRNDGASGIALHFVWMEPSAPERLEGLIANLPSIESLQYDKTQPIVLSEIVEPPSDEDED